MSMHSVAEAKNRLSELIDRALQGEGVIITRHGRPVVEIRPVSDAGRPVSRADIDWLAAHRVGSFPARLDAGSLVSRMRDEDDAG